ncbi:hypothetical protein BD413DRAFT_246854 [Trametes elegans]|nr:hypothetical protein BD413DRAFT_246854 [Trametes elegans]
MPSPRFLSARGARYSSGSRVAGRSRFGDGEVDREAGKAYRSEGACGSAGAAGQRGPDSTPRRQRLSGRQLETAADSAYRSGRDVSTASRAADNLHCVSRRRQLYPRTRTRDLSAHRQQSLRSCTVCDLKSPRPDDAVRTVGSSMAVATYLEVHCVTHSKNLPYSGPLPFIVGCISWE